MTQRRTEAIALEMTTINPPLSPEPRPLIAAAAQLAPPRHSFLEDIQGIVFGSFMAGFGVTVLTHLGLVTGQTAGLAILISYIGGWAFGLVFLAVNLPFYVLGYLRFGLIFTLKSFIAVGLMTLSVAWLPQHLSFARLDPSVGALLAGACTGVGLIALFRHGASLGGIGILGLMIQDRTGFRAGLTQLVVDVAIFAAALAVMPVRQVAWSALGALVLNLMIAVNHRRDRYIA